jgi:hypothetical protein
MNDEHVLTLIEAIDGTNFNAVRELALDAILVDDVGHTSSLLTRTGPCDGPQRWCVCRALVP